MKIADISPTYSLFPSFIHRRSSTSTASMSTGGSTQSTLCNTLRTTTKISSRVVVDGLSSRWRSRAREVEVFGKRPFKFRVSRHRIWTSGKEREKRKRSEPDLEDRSIPISPMTTLSATFKRDGGELEKFDVESGNEEMDSACPAAQTSNSPSVNSPIPAPTHQEEENLGFPFGKPIYHASTSTRGRDLGSIDSNIPISHPATDPHPGTLVTFTSSSGPPFACPEQIEAWLTSCASRPSAPSPTYTHHGALDHLALASQPSSKPLQSKSPPTTPKSVPEVNPTTVHKTSIPETPAPAQSQPRKKNISYQASKLERLALSLKERELVLRYGDTSACSPSENRLGKSTGTEMGDVARSSQPAPTSHRSSSSVSSSSTFVFLDRVRASFEARRSGDLGRGAWCVGYDVFVDEPQRGFLEGFLAI
jgi:hypothetical protein